MASKFGSGFRTWGRTSGMDRDIAIENPVENEMATTLCRASMRDARDGGNLAVPRIL